eukprot:Nk52_evm2s2133 gene=Nk52_evmTU2s2133
MVDALDTDLESQSRRANRRSTGIAIVWDAFAHQKVWWRKEYILEYVVLTIFFILAYIPSRFIDPYQRYIPEDDPNITYPLKNDIVPNYALGLIAAVAPAVIFIASYFWYRSAHDVHHSLLGLAQSLAFTGLYSQYLKVFAGRPRPDNLAMLQNGDSSEAYLSFPSGHASISFGGLLYLSLWFSGKIGLFRKDGGEIYKAVVVNIPVCAAWWVAVSRTRDYHHNFSDILAGVCIGSGCAVVGYFLNYPSLFSEYSHIPKLRQLDDRAKSKITKEKMRRLTIKRRDSLEARKSFEYTVNEFNPSMDRGVIALENTNEGLRVTGEDPVYGYSDYGEMKNNECPSQGTSGRTQALQRLSTNSGELNEESNTYDTPEAVESSATKLTV